MKKLFIVLFTLMSLLGCSKENSIVGTKWTYEFNGSPYLMEFTSETDVRTYETDSNYNYKSSLIEGKYTYDNGKITFGENFGVVRGAMLVLYYRYYFKNATLSGDVMRVNASDETIIFPVVDGKVQEPEITYNGEHTFVLMKL